MPHGPPTKPPVVAKPAAPNPAVTETVPERMIPAGLSYVERLQHALGVIDEHRQTPSGARAILGVFYRFVSPHANLQHLPRSLHVHPRFPERSASATDKWELFYFHLGNASKGMVDAYAADIAYGKLQKKTDDAKQHVLDLIAIMEARIARLELLVQLGPALWVAYGDDADGHRLLTKEEYEAAEAAALAKWKAKEEAREARAAAKDGA